MSTRVTFPAPTYHPRRTGWTAFPVRCPRCHDYGHAERIGDVSLAVNGAGVRCTRCSSLLFIIPVTRLRIAFVAEVTFADIQVMEERHMTLEQSMEYLGASFPYTRSSAA